MKKAFDEVELGSVANVFSGYAFKSVEMNPVEGIPLVKIKNVNNKKVSKDCDTFLNFEAYEKKYRKYYLQDNDFLVAMTGQGSVGRIGKMRGGSGIHYLVNQRVGIVRADHELVVPEYLYQCVARDEIEQVYFNLAMGAGQPNLSPKDIGKLRIPYPPIPIQQKIARILSAYDELIENNLKRIKLLEEMAQITYEQWFVRMKFPGHETTPMDAETGLPEVWVEAEISALCHVNFDSITKKTAPESIRYIDIASVNTSDYETPRELSFSDAPSRARRRVKFGDTIFSTVRPNRKIYALIMENDPLLVASTGFATLTPGVSGIYPFVYLSVANQVFVDKAVAVAGGAAYPAVNQKDFERIKVTIPEERVILEFSELINGNFKLMGDLKVQNQLLKEAREILLPRLMTGMIDVDEIELPEIATM